MARASRTQVEEELGKIAQIVDENPNGISRKALGRAYSKRFHKTIPSRTLQRRLEQLLIRAEVISQGDGPGIVYRPIREEASVVLSEGYPPLSADGAKARALVRQPISQRLPVGYDTDWLFAYQPGKTWYLPKKIRAHLHEVGVTPDDNRPAGTFARDILGRLLIDLAWASSRLEGNTYTRLDTQNLLEFGQRAAGKNAQEAQMILNHKTAIELLVSGAEYVGFNRRTLLAVHTALSENLLSDPTDEGRLRERPVSIAGTSYTPIAIPQIIRECFDRILDTAARIPDPFEQAFFAMVHIPYLQPFTDVNKRTSRLAANIPLIATNLCPLSFVDVPENAYVEGTLAVYERKRVELLRDVFVFAYERSSAQYRVVRESLGQPDPIRLRYRNELADTITQTVKAGEAPGRERLRRRGEALGVPDEDLDAFSETALKVLIGLHEGSASRYGLSPSEFEQWRVRFAGS